MGSLPGSTVSRVLCNSSRHVGVGDSLVNASSSCFIACRKIIGCVRVLRRGSTSTATRG